jgi:formyltetrahydrofolate-dependent phosphoribosylglycinamide formyltransferase
MSGRVKVGVLISGRGSNMSALIAAAKAPDYPAEIALVIANVADAGGLETARAEGVQAIAIDSKPFGKDREAHEKAMDAALREAGVQVVCLAGFMRLLTPWFVDAWSGRMLNIHPSLLPDFKGLHTHARAIAAGKEEAGCSVHVVTAELDEGPILGQARVPVLPADTEETLAARVLKEEHRLYPSALAAFCRALP